MNSDSHWITGFSIHMLAPPPHNCVIQVACQSCERSSQAHVDVGLIYIVEGETKTAQAKWNVWIVRSCRGASVALCARFIPLEGSTLTLVCSANFGGLLG